MVLYSTTGAVLRATRSRPAPNVETEQKIREQLKTLDALLDIRWFPYAVIHPVHQDFEGRYGLVCQWPQGDKRWSLYQSGEIEDPIDMLGWFCTDLHDANSTPVDPESIIGKVMQLLHGCDGERLSHTRRMAQVIEQNEKMRMNRRKDAGEKAAQMAKDIWYMSGHSESVKMDRIIKEISQGKE